jgi:hypothetical protein
MNEFTRKYWAHVVSRKTATSVGPFETREAAVDACFRANPKAKAVTSGYGSEGAWFDIRWTNRHDSRG